MANDKLEDDLNEDHLDLEPNDGKDEGEGAKEKEVLSPQEGIEDLRRQLAAETKARKEAEDRERSAAQDNLRLRNEAQSSDLQTISSAIEVMRGNQNAAKQNLKKALAEGDVDAIADLNEEIAQNSIKLAQLDQGREALETRTRTPQAPADQVEALAVQLSPRSAAWVRNHPEYVKDPRKYQAMIGAHNVALGNGATVDTDDYFEQIERILNIASAQNVDTGEDDEDPMGDAAKVVQRRSSPSPAPVSRTTHTPTNERNNTIRLSAAEREMAANLGMTDEEYAKNKRMLIREGRIN